jgi:hypothetical protein
MYIVTVENKINEGIKKEERKETEEKKSKVHFIVQGRIDCRCTDIKTPYTTGQSVSKPINNVLLIVCSYSRLLLFGEIKLEFLSISP